ncbi:hypothetical protein [Mycobacteroides chelonae]|uniref:hypothetical protein n=1 Tax=Mycobacteroides chelonae TaxID=1774 RepID=UPI000993E49D
MTDEPIDPVQHRNQEDEHAVLELAQLDAGLDEQQCRLDELAHRDPVGLVWFGDDDAWVQRQTAGGG